MKLWAAHELAQGAGALDVVRDMWNVSRVYPALPSSVLLRRERVDIRTLKPVFRQTNMDAYVYL